MVRYAVQVEPFDETLLTRAIGSATTEAYAEELVELLRRDSRVRTGQLRAGYFWYADYDGSGDVVIGNWVPYAPFVHERYGNRYGRDPILDALGQLARSVRR